MYGKVGMGAARVGARAAVRGAARSAQTAARNAGRQVARQGLKNATQAGGKAAARAVANSAPGRAAASGFRATQRAGARIKPYLGHAAEISQGLAMAAPYIAAYGGDKGKQVAVILDDRKQYSVGGRSMSRKELLEELEKAEAALAKTKI